jgi:hypothetical protein
MNKKYMLGSILCILLMLVSTQTMLLNIVRSDPPIHEGTAYVGDLWISELDVSSTLQEVEYIGVGHAEATDDYVTWVEGTGEITANWSVSIQTTYHPAYNVEFTLVVCNVDDNCSSMGMDYAVIDYDEDTKYNDSGQLTLNIQLDQDFIKNNTEATLVCYLNAAVKINNTVEATNFTTWAQDRCVIGIVLDEETSEEPYSRFITEANDNYPNIWSWQTGWDQGNRFSDEDDMLETQTFFHISGNQNGQEGDWKMGQFDIYMQVGEYEVYTNHYGFSKGVNFPQNGQIKINPFWSVVFHYTSGSEISFNRLVLKHENISYYEKSQIRTYGMGDGDMGVSFDVSEDDLVNTYFGYPAVKFSGYAWSIGRYLSPTCTPIGLRYLYKTGNTGSTGSTNFTESGYYWESSCGYFNSTFNIGVDSSTDFGITTVDCDISDVLLAEGEQYVYTYAADVGDTRIELSC